MSQQLVVWGSSSSVISYNLARQFVTVPKVIITPDTVFAYLEGGEQVRQRLDELKHLGDQDFHAAVQQSAQLFDGEFSSDFYKSLQDQLKQIGDDFSDIKLKDYNFMNSVSNTKYTVYLRCEDYSLSRYFVEKGSLLSALRSLLSEYVSFAGNAYRKQRIAQFQIEITVSEEYHKHVFLKKEHNKLVLAASFGYPRSHPFDYDIGPECYYSEGESFHLYENSQQIAHIRDQARFSEQEIYHQQKVLQNQDLVAINDATKNIHDALIEAYITKKGAVKLLHVGLLESSVVTGNEQGFLLSKSSKQYDRVALVTLRDNLSEEYTNPKYLLLRNEQEVKEFLEHLDTLNQVDGVVFTENCYHPVLDHLGDQLDMDIIFYKGDLQKSLDVRISPNEIIIEAMDGNAKATNPFSSIISEESKQEDAFLERLKQVDLYGSEQQEQQSGAQDQQARQEVSGIAESIISSPQSSTKSNPTQQRGEQHMTASPYDEQGKKRSAIEMLADTVLNNNGKPVEEQQQQGTPQQSQQPETQQQQPEQSSSVGASNTFSEGSSGSSGQGGTSDASLKNSQFVMDDVSGDDIRNASQDQVSMATGSSPAESPSSSSSEEVSKRYGGVLATTLLTPPTVDSGAYFVDPNTISQVQGGEIYYVASSPDEMQNPNIHYVVPVAIGEVPQSAYALVNSSDDFFLLSQAKSARMVFVNLSHIHAKIQENFLKAHLRECGEVGVIVNQQQLPVLAPHIAHISAVFVKDINSSEQYQEAKETLLGFEKRALLQQFKQ